MGLVSKAYDLWQRDESEKTPDNYVEALQALYPSANPITLEESGGYFEASKLEVEPEHLYAILRKATRLSAPGVSSVQYEHLSDRRMIQMVRNFSEY